MEIGIDSFAANPPNHGADSAIGRHQALAELLERMVYADEVGLDTFGIGEHHRQEFLDSAPTIILAAACTQRIRLSSAVTVLSAADPVRLFQNFATLDLISQGRADMVVGRGSFTEAFPLFGLNLQAYDALFSEKLDLLLMIREQEVGFDALVVPTLVDVEKTAIIADSRLICLYLCDQVDGGDLLPADIREPILAQLDTVDLFPHVALLYGANPDGDRRPPMLRQAIYALDSMKYAVRHWLGGYPPSEWVAQQSWCTGKVGLNGVIMDCTRWAAFGHL